LPRPFADDAPRGVRDDARALWAWLAALRVAGMEDRAPNPAAVRDGARRLRAVPEAVAAAAYDACARHDLGRAGLAAQADAAHAWAAPVRFATAADLDAFVRAWAGRHARHLGGLVGLSSSFHAPALAELGRGFFLTRCLVYLPDDAAHDRCFVPLDDLRRYGVSVERLRAGDPDEPVRKVLWRQSVRARDALAQGRAAVAELPWRSRLTAARYWLGALALLDAAERSGFDVWTRRPRLSLLRRAQITLQAAFGKSVSR
jgi:phytoene synthase